MSYQMVVIEREETWNAWIKKSLEPDFFHTWQYHSLDKSGTPILFLLYSGNDFIALPLIKRKISGSDLFDLTSAYGYVGPVSNKKFEDLDEEILAGFRNSIGAYMKSSQCVCVFSRLHPFINQQYLLNKVGGVVGNGETIYIDLTTSIEDQRAQYDKRLFIRIKKLRKRGYTIKEAKTPDDIVAFTKIYTQSMRRVNASNCYFFKQEYFTELLNITEFNCSLLMMYNRGEAICGAIIMCSNSIIRNHLAATSNDYVKDSPSKLLTDEISLIGRARGMKYFHLGGGVGGKCDSLFDFKRQFSNLTLEDNTWRYIADQAAYNNLLKDIDLSIESDFFPLYRSVRNKIALQPAITVSSSL